MKPGGPSFLLVFQLLTFLPNCLCFCMTVSPQWPGKYFSYYTQLTPCFHLNKILLLQQRWYWPIWNGGPASWLVCSSCAYASAVLRFHRLEDLDSFRVLIVQKSIPNCGILVLIVVRRLIGELFEGGLFQYRWDAAKWLNMSGMLVN